MPHIVRVNTDEMRTLGQAFKSQNQQFEQWKMGSASYWKGEADRSGWFGKSREHFDALVQENDIVWLHFSELGDQIGQHLLTTADKFDAANSSMDSISAL